MVDNTPLHVLRLTAHNILRLKAVDITPKPGEPLVVLAGDNAQGKSSVLTSLAAALDWSAISRKTPKPIHAGATRADTTVYLGPPGGDPELIVERTFTEKGTYLRVSAADGAKYTSPQAMLDKLKGLCTINPLAYIDADAKKLRALLLDVAEVPADLDEFDRREEQLLEERRDANRDWDRAAKSLQNMVQPDPETPTEPVDASDLYRRQAHASAATDKIAYAGEQLRTDEARIKRLEEELRAAREQLEETKTNLEDLQRAYEAEDLEQLAAQIANAEEINAAIAERTRYDEQAHLVETYKDLAAQADADVQGVRAERQQALEAAQWPLPDLSVTAEGVIYQGIPLEQASTAERLRFSAALAMATHPRLRVLLVPHGANDLDGAGWKILREIAEERGFHVWVETVDTSRASFLVEDGTAQEV